MDEFIQYLESLGIIPPAGTGERLRAFHRMLTTANNRHNLTRITEFDDFLFKHVADSLLVAAAWPPVARSRLFVADVGCGAGFPGLPLAILFPGISTVEIDSSTKKISCVEHFVEDLDLPRCRPTVSRARELSRRAGYRGAFDLVLARAVSDTPSLIRECRLFLKPTGSALIAYKTPRAIAEEKTLVEREAAKAHLEVNASDVYRLPRQRGERQFWILSREDES